MINEIKMQLGLLLGTLVIALSPSIAHSVVTDNDVAGRCSQVNPGGRLLHLADQILLQTEDLAEPYSIPRKTLEISQPFASTSYPELQYEGEIYRYRFAGPIAANLYLKLLKSHQAKKQKLNCRFLDFEQGILFADGVTCRAGRMLNRGDFFSCVMIVYGKNKQLSASTFIPLPRPSMGAGNTTNIDKVIEFLEATGTLRPSVDDSADSSIIIFDGANPLSDFFKIQDWDTFTEQFNFQMQ